MLLLMKRSVIGGGKIPTGRQWCRKSQSHSADGGGASCHPGAVRVIRTCLTNTTDVGVTHHGHVHVVVVGQSVQHLDDGGFHELQGEAADAAAAAQTHRREGFSYRALLRPTGGTGALWRRYSHIHYNDHVLWRWSTLDIPATKAQRESFNLEPSSLWSEVKREAKVTVSWATITRGGWGEERGGLSPSSAADHSERLNGSTSSHCATGTCTYAVQTNTVQYSSILL